MDPILTEKLDKIIPKINPLIGRGYSTIAMQDAVKYIDQIWKNAQRAFPEGMTYEGYQVATPREVLQDQTRERSMSTTRRRYLEHADSFRMMIKFYFNYNGERLDKTYENSRIKSDYLHIYVPFLKEGNFFKLRGSSYTVAPVIADNGLSVESDNIHVSIPMFKMNVKQVLQHFKLDDQSQTVKVAWSNFYNKKIEASKVLTAANPTLAHYNFIKYGVKGTLERFCKVSDVLYFDYMPDETITKDYHIFHTACGVGFRPARMKRVGAAGTYIPTTLHVGIKKTELTPEVMLYMGALFYLVDYFPDRFQAEYMQDPEGEDWVFKALMGVIHFPEDQETKRVERVERHIESVDIYVDPISVEDLAYDDIHVSNTYELFDKIIATMDKRLMSASSNIASMYGKRLSVMNFFLSDVKNMILAFAFTVQRLENPSREAIIKLMRDRKVFDPERPMSSLTKGGHGELEIFGSPGDSMLFKTTSRLTLQENANTKQKQEFDPRAPKNQLHVSIAEVASYVAAAKSNPMGRDKINCYIDVNEQGFIQRDPRFIELLDDVQKVLDS